MMFFIKILIGLAIGLLISRKEIKIIIEMIKNKGGK